MQMLSMFVKQMVFDWRSLASAVKLWSRNASDRDVVRVIPASVRNASADCAPGCPASAATSICVAAVENAALSHYIFAQIKIVGLD
jgi:hypothetical protein